MDTGKIRRNKYRIHAAAIKITPNNNVSVVVEPITNLLTNTIKSNIFRNVTISPEALKQKLPSYSKQDKTNLDINNVIKDSNLSTEKVKRSFTMKESWYMKKYSKRIEGIPRRRKIPFHELVSTAKEFLEKREKEKKKAKEGILTNFKALEEALPALEQLIEEKNKDDAKPRAAKPFSVQNAEMMEDIQTYQQALNNPEYAADPIGIITAQLKQRIESGSL